MTDMQTAVHTNVYIQLDEFREKYMPMKSLP